MDGVFTVEVDFMTFAQLFNTNSYRYLEIQVRDGGLDTSILSPRQKIVPAPQAHYELDAKFAETSGSSLDLAYRYGNEINFESFFGPLRLKGTEDRSPQIQFINRNDEIRIDFGLSPLGSTSYLSLY